MERERERERERLCKLTPAAPALRLSVDMAVLYVCSNSRKDVSIRLYLNVCSRGTKGVPRKRGLNTRV